MISPPIRANIKATPTDWGLAGLLASGQFGFLLALYPVAGIGIWFQSEPVIAANFAIAGCAMAVLAVRRGTRGVRLLPPVLAILALALWSLAMLPFAASMPDSWLGPPQTGQGIAALLALAGFATAMTALRGRSAPLALVVGASWAAALLLTGLLLWAPRAWQPYHFSDGAAFNALFAWAVTVAWRPRRPAVIAAATLALVVLAYLSDNRAVMVALAGGAAAFGLIALWSTRPRVRNLAGALPIIAAIAIPVLLATVGTFDRLRDLPLSVRDTVVSRANMVRVVTDDVASRPVTALSGLGWGTYDIALARNLAQDNAALQSTANDDGLLFWDAAHRNDFHSHNELAETLLAVGLPGVLAALAFLGFLAASVPRRRLALATAFAVALAILSGFWFQLPSALPAFGVAIGLMAGPGTIVRRRTFAVAALVGAILLATTSGATLLRAHGGRLEVAKSADGACAAPVHGFARPHFQWLMQRQWHRLSELLEDGAPSELVRPVALRLADLLCAADGSDNGADRLPLNILAVVIRGDLVNMTWPDDLAQLKEAVRAPWRDGLIRVLARAPSRSDLAVPYLSWLIAHNQEADMSRFAASHLPPNDPVALWYTGIGLLADPATLPAGVGKMKKALALGAERFIVIPSDLKAQIQNFR